MTLEELSRVSQAMGIQSGLLCFYYPRAGGSGALWPFCNDIGWLRTPISLPIGLRMGEKSGDSCFLAIGSRGETGCHFRKKPGGLLVYSS